MTETVQIIVPTGAFGTYAGEDPITTAMRIIGIGFGKEDEWATKYGTDYENDVFMMKRYCWCEKNDGSCAWCMHGDNLDFDRLLREQFGTVDYQAHRSRGYYDPPNFWFKPTDFRLTWYKYIGRDMASNAGTLPPDFMDRIFETHPASMSVDQAIKKALAYEEASSAAFTKMMERITRIRRKE